MGLATRSTPIGPGIGVLTILGVAVCGLVILTQGRTKTVLVVLLGALALRLALLSLDTSLHLFPKADAIRYHQRAAALANSWQTGEPWTAMNNVKTTAYEVVIAPLYYVFGSSPVLARTFNCVLSVLAIFNIGRIAEFVVDRRAAWWGAAAFAAMPSVVRIHTEHLREALILLVLTQILYVLVSETFRRIDGALLALGLVAWLFLLRRPTALTLGVALAAFLTVWAGVRLGGWVGSGRGARATGVAFTVGSSALAVLGVLASADRRGWLGKLRPEALTELRNDWALGDSAYLADQTFSSWSDVLLFAPLGAVYFLFTPFPWQVHNVLALAAVTENLLYFYPVAILSALFLARTGLTFKRFALVSVLIVSAVLYGLVEGNVGTVLRHRAQFTWIFFLFAGPVLHRAYERAVWWEPSPEPR